MTFEYGVIERLSPLIRRIVARNPGPFTFHGTATYIVGHGAVAVIDPGPALDDHVAAILAGLDGETISHQFITHTHRDHSPAARLLGRACGAKTYGFGPHGAGREERAVEEGADRDFVPDVVLRDGDVIEGDGWSLTAVHTPGHASNHLCFALAEESTLFSGDHVMGWSSTVIVPPDGDMAAYLASLRRLLARDDRLYRPTHGPAIENPKVLVRAYLDHRADRERQIVDCLKRGIGGIPAMVEEIYADVPQSLHPAAACSVLAHLIHMVEENRAACDGEPRTDGVFSLES
ncbi:MAG: MBL fold metallo-hydrolase [Proteobacteria bacterium]|nr:MBL fold metallo-hydrolase [Pseudomonadota bacterium]